jgi:hypothetical protein
VGALAVSATQAALLIAYLIVFGFGTVVLIVGFGTSFLRNIAALALELAAFARAPQPSTIQPLWLRLQRVMLGGAWTFFVTYAAILLFWWNRASLPEVLAYATACAVAFFVIRKTPSSTPPRSASALVLLTVLVAGCAAAYAWGLNAAILHGWSASGYFIAARRCDANFDHCIESGPYATPTDCRRVLLSVNGSLTTFACIRLQDVPRAYLPWAT